MSYDDTNTRVVDVENARTNNKLPPSAFYKPRKYRYSENPIYNRNQFESYMNQPQLISRAALRHITRPLAVIDITKPIPITDVFGPDPHYYDTAAVAAFGTHYSFGFEEWNQDNLPPESEFWTQWVSDQMDYEYGGDRDGLWSFANNLIWMRHRTSSSSAAALLAGTSTPHQKMYIAYLTMMKSPELHTNHRCLDPHEIIKAVCVLVQPSGVYFILGMTKSINFQNAFNGSSIKLQQYIASIIHTKVDPHTLGLLFRPNMVMRDRMHRSITETQSVGADFYIGSNWDKWWCEKIRKTWRGDDEPSIIQSYDDGITLPCAVDSGNMAYFVTNYSNDDTTVQKRTMTILTPFWESPSMLCNPDGPNNPHLPLLFVPIKTLLSWRLSI